MPRGNPKRRMMFRIDPELVAAVQALTSNMTAAVEEGLRLWLARTKRRKAGGGCDAMSVTPRNPLTRRDVSR